MKVFKSSLEADHLISRSIPVNWISPDAQGDALHDLSDQPFVQEATYDQDSGLLTVEYDTSHTDLRDIETLLQRLGAEIPRTWRQRLAGLWHNIQDHNRGMSETLDADQQVHCHTNHQKPAERHAGWRSWPED